MQENITTKKHPGLFIDLTGQRFGRLLIIRESKDKIGKGVRWECWCDCGNPHQASTNGLKRGSIQSCGCLGKETATTHGMSKTAEYHSWTGMFARCYKPKNQDYPRYGGRGIQVCERWRHSFENFLEDMGMKPTHRHTLDRIDCDGNYEPANCKWSTPKEQARNRITTPLFEFQGESLSRAEWAERYGISVHVLCDRLGRGWDMERALTTPKKKAP